MKIIVIAAMQKELDLILQQMPEHEIVENCGSKYYKGRIGNNYVAVAQCGIGKVNAALRTSELIDALDPDLVINSGVAGGLDEKMRIGDILVADRITYHDVWCGPGTVVGQADCCPLYYTPRESELGMLREMACRTDSRIKFGLLCSGDRFISTPEEMKHIKSLFADALACDMESAAIAQTCYKRDVPFIAVRVMSDMPGGGENISEYTNFWKDAPVKTFMVVRDLINCM